MEDKVFKQALCRHSDGSKFGFTKDGRWCCRRCEKILTSDFVRKRFEEAYGATADYMFRLMALYELSARNRRRYELEDKMIKEKMARIRKHMDDYYNFLKSKN
jgi:hypothetical protein